MVGSLLTSDPTDTRSSLLAMVVLIVVTLAILQLRKGTIAYYLEVMGRARPPWRVLASISPGYVS